MSVKESTPWLNQRQFEELHQNYYDRLLAGMKRYVRNLDEAEDITATAFAAAWSHRAGFRGQASAYTWLYSIGRNAARTAYRGSRMPRLESLDDPNFAEPGSPDVLTAILEQSEILHAYA